MTRAQQIARYRARARALLERRSALDATAAREIAKLFDAARLEAARRMKRYKPEQWSRRYLSQIQTDTAQMVRELMGDFRERMADLVRRSGVLGASTLPESLAAAGFGGVAVPAFDVAATLSGLQAELVTQMGDDLRRRLQHEVTVGILSGRPQQETIARVAGTLRAGRAGTSIFGSYERRAETIARTETMRAYNLGNNDSIDRVAMTAGEMGIALSRRWVATKDGRTRPRHAHMDGQTVPIGKKFVYPGVGEVDGPMDPRLPAKDSINCRCVAVVIMQPATREQPRKAA